MPQTYKFSYVSGHVVAEIDGKKCLFDTGSPVSFGSGTLRIGDREHQLQGNQLGFNLKEIASQVGGEIDALIAGDILKNYVLCIWLEKGELVLSEERIIEGPCELPIKLVYGVPTFEIEIDGRKVRAALDTGAPISYASDGLIGDSPRATDTPKRDFYPGRPGTFETYGHELPFRLCEADSSFVFYALPSDLAPLLTMVGCEAIIGMDWLHKFSPVWVQINYLAKKISFSK